MSCRPVLYCIGIVMTLHRVETYRQSTRLYGKGKDSIDVYRNRAIILQHEVERLQKVINKEGRES